MMGIEPTTEAWEASVLPLNYIRVLPFLDGNLPLPFGSLGNIFDPLKCELTPKSTPRYSVRQYAKQRITCEKGYFL